MPEQLSRQYKQLKKTSVESLGGAAVAKLISDMAVRARQILQSTERVQLNSVTGKNYFSFRGREQSRPVNVALYEDRDREFARMLSMFRDGLPSNDVDGLPAQRIR